MNLISNAGRAIAAGGAAAIRAVRSQRAIAEAAEKGGSMAAVRPPDPTVVCRVNKALRRRSREADRSLYPVANKTTVRTAAAFPTAVIDVPWGHPVEVSLIGELPLGAGNALFAEATLRQSQHATYEDEHNEESAKIGSTALADEDGSPVEENGDGPLDGAWYDRSGRTHVGEDKTALYTFSVGGRGHPYHRHEGHRCFTAVAGTSGCRLAFSPATPAEVEADARAFFDALQFVDIPPDGLFTVRFNGGVWHQFASLRPPDPAFFAISVHTDETGGDLDPEVAAAVARNESSIGLLTQRLPEAVQAALAQPHATDKVPVLVLTTDDAYA